MDRVVFLSWGAPRWAILCLAFPYCLCTYSGMNGKGREERLVVLLIFVWVWAKLPGRVLPGHERASWPDATLSRQRFWPAFFAQLPFAWARNFFKRPVFFESFMWAKRLVGDSPGLFMVVTGMGFRWWQPYRWQWWQVFSWLSPVWSSKTRSFHGYKPGRMQVLDSAWRNNVLGRPHAQQRK